MTATSGREELDHLEFVLNADLSHDGTQVVYTTLQTSEGDDTITMSITAVGGDDPARRIDVDGVPMAPAWSPDGASVAVTAQVGDVRQVVIVDVASGESRVLTELEHGVRGGVAWSPDGRSIATAAVRSRRTDANAVYVVDRVPWRLDGLGEVGDLLCDVVTIDVASGAVSELTNGPTIDVDPRWSPDGRSVLFVRSHDPDDLGPMERHVVVGPDGERDLDWAGGMSAAGAFIDDERVVSTCFRESDRRRGSSCDVHVSTVGGGAENRTEGLDLQFGGALLADIPTSITDPRRWLGVDGDAAIVPVLVGGSVHVARVALSGPQHVEWVLDGDRGCNPIAVRNGQLLYAVSTANALPDLFVRDLATGNDVRVTDIDRTVGMTELRVDKLDARSGDGTPVEAWYHHPVGGEGPHPTVLLIHGGPFAAYGNAMNMNARHLAMSGIGVLLSNPRSSLGYGTAFGTATRGKWGTLDYQDLMAVTDAAIDAGYADPARLGVCGNSYGGYMTTWIVGHTDRFRAAVAENPVVEFRSMRGVSDIGITFTDDVVGGSPVDIPDVYHEMSPISHIHNCVTPTRVVISEIDRRVPPFQGEWLHSALLEAGCETDMVRMPGASHSGGSGANPDVRRAEDDAIVEWMVRHLLAE